MRLTRRKSVCRAPRSDSRATAHRYPEPFGPAPWRTIGIGAVTNSRGSASKPGPELDSGRPAPGASQEVNTGIVDQRYHRSMSDMPTGPSHGPGLPPAPATPPPWAPAPPMAPRKPARWPAFAMLVITLIAVGAAVATWLRPLPETKTPSAPPAPTFTGQQIADAKANICDVFKTVSKAVDWNTHLTNPVPGDEIAARATQVYGTLALYEGGDYLLDRLAAEPATSPELAKPIKSLGETLKKFGIVVLAGEPDSARDPLRHAVDADFTTIDGLCK